MAFDPVAAENQVTDILAAIAEGGQFTAIADKQFKRADLKASFDILLLLQHQNARLINNNGFGLCSFGD